GLLEDGDDLTVGVTGRLHAELSKIIFRKFYSFQRLFAGGITIRTRIVAALSPSNFLYSLTTSGSSSMNRPL
ncbi:hypothetical protein, partial [Undibacterium sp. Xuan67W]|uniref:hypothetical protein n=1 Tax=Undibacterium sp. Xuan67W TaxID=3413057 RepID=UPI003BF160DE